MPSPAQEPTLGDDAVSEEGSSSGREDSEPGPVPFKSDPSILGKLPLYDEWPYAERGRADESGRRLVWIASDDWRQTMNSQERLKCVNEYRKGLGQRIAANWKCLTCMLQKKGNAGQSSERKE